VSSTDSTEESSETPAEESAEGSSESGLFNPNDHPNAEDVITYLQTASAEEKERVLALESEGLHRVSVLGS
jgi:hypothetical protein